MENIIIEKKTAKNKNSVKALNNFQWSRKFKTSP